MTVRPDVTALSARGRAVRGIQCRGDPRAGSRRLRARFLGITGLGMRVKSAVEAADEASASRNKPGVAGSNPAGGTVNSRLRRLTRSTIAAVARVVERRPSTVDLGGLAKRRPRAHRAVGPSETFSPAARLDGEHQLTHDGGPPSGYVGQATWLTAAKSLVPLVEPARTAGGALAGAEFSTWPSQVAGAGAPLALTVLPSKINEEG